MELGAYNQELGPKELPHTLTQFTQNRFKDKVGSWFKDIIVFERASSAASLVSRSIKYAFKCALN